MSVAPTSDWHDDPPHTTLILFHSMFQRFQLRYGPDWRLNFRNIAFVPYELYSDLEYLDENPMSIYVNTSKKIVPEAVIKVMGDNGFDYSCERNNREPDMLRSLTKDCKKDDRVIIFIGIILSEDFKPAILELLRRKIRVHAFCVDKAEQIVSPAFRLHFLTQESDLFMRNELYTDYVRQVHPIRQQPMSVREPPEDRNLVAPINGISVSHVTEMPEAIVSVLPEKKSDESSQATIQERDAAAPLNSDLSGPSSVPSNLNSELQLLPCDATSKTADVPHDTTTPPTTLDPFPEADAQEQPDLATDPSNSPSIRSALATSTPSPSRGNFQVKLGTVQRQQSSAATQGVHSFEEDGDRFFGHRIYPTAGYHPPYFEAQPGSPHYTGSPHYAGYDAGMHGIMPQHSCCSCHHYQAHVRTHLSSHDIDLISRRVRADLRLPSTF